MEKDSRVEADFKFELEEFCKNNLKSIESEVAAGEWTIEGEEDRLSQCGEFLKDSIEGVRVTLILVYSFPLLIFFLIRYVRISLPF